MSKNSKSLLLTKVVSSVAIVIVALAAINYVILLFIYEKMPVLKDIGEARHYLVDSVAFLVGSTIILAALFRSPKFSRAFLRLFGGMESLIEVNEHSDFPKDTGLAHLDSSGRIISATHFLVSLSRDKTLDSVVGHRFDRVFSDNFSRLLAELLDKAKLSKQVAATAVPDWSQYCSETVGPAMIYVTPSYVNQRFIGAIIVVRSTEDVRNAENSAIYYHMHYQILFDSLPLGAAVFRPSVAPDGGVDGYIVTANPALKKTLEGIPLPFNEPCSAVWPSFMQQSSLREAIAEAINTGLAVRCDLFSPALGKSLEVFMTQLPGGRTLCIVVDQTEQRMNEQKVLALNDQLKRTLVGQSEYVNEVLDDIQHFNQATADLVETHLETIRAVVPEVGDHVAADLINASSGLYQSLNQMLRYHNVSNLPFKDTALIYPAEVVTRLLEPLGNRFPDIAFHIESLPGVVANREILTNILEQLMVSLAQLPVVAGSGRIEIGSRQDFTATSITVSGWGFDTSPIFIETPSEQVPLDWTLTSDLDIAPVRCMVKKHGGQLFIAPTPDGLGVELSFSIGTPTL